MGVGYQGLQIALLAKRRQVDFSRTITLGRQNHYLNARMLQTMCSRFGIPVSTQQEQSVLRTDFAEGLFEFLGAETVDSMDASGYESATIVHDMNRPIDESLIRRYSCVVDFGTLEHVFHFPNAIKNATDMLVEGGCLVSVTIANNFMGHGFYQFSPELFFRYLAANGFGRIELFLVPHRDFPYVFRVTDPKELGGRVELVNAEPVSMAVLAWKTEHIREMVVPTQSDYYEHFWQGRDIDRRAQLPAADPQTARAVSDMKRQVMSLLGWPETISPTLVHGFENSLHYNLIDPATA